MSKVRLNLSERDQKHIWHPLTQHRTASPPIGIVKASGALLWDEDGVAYIDAIASWYTAMYGHCNEHIAAAVSEQLYELDQVVFTGFTHKPAVRLSELLMEILPSDQQKIFFNDNGSTAVEAAIKMAIQYHFNKGEKRDTLLAFENGFHGDTFGAMSASGISVYNGPFEEFFLKVKRIPTPQQGNTEEVLEQAQKLISEHSVAGFLYEPLVQGAAGMKFYEADGLEAILTLCKENGILCIADEVMTGFGKTGKNFASEYLNTQPDMMCLSKALTAGMVAMSITSSTQQVYDAFLSETVEKGFMHAHTYSANPLGCAAAIAGIKLLTSEEIQNDIRRITAAHSAFAKSIEGHANVDAVRSMGVILAIDLNVETDRYGALRNNWFQYFMDKGIFLRPLGNTIYVLPPYVITDKELLQVYDAISTLIDTV